LLGLLVSCHPPASRFPPEAPLWRDPDRRPFAAELRPYYSPHDWDRIEKTFVLPVQDALAVRVTAEAVNVNALDEVPDSSWFENRIERLAHSRERAALGPCIEPVAARDGPWRVVSAKPDGATPGFVFEASDGQRYLAKFDGASGSPRASLADVLGSRLYHAAGFRVPCNSIIYFDEANLQIQEGARAENMLGEKVPLTEAHLRAITRKALRRADGRVRCMASRYLEGRSLGPWRYHGVRPGDRNDIVRHEERRELRGARLLAAWTDHVDQREGNTLAMWHPTGSERGYVMHHLIDFGDCFGSVWGGSAQEAWRRGHDYWIDPGTMLIDWLSLGALERPWDRASLGPFGLVLGYYDVDSFDAERWRPRFPNPAFSRMTEHDAAWMARILARIDPELVEGMLEQADAPAQLHSELARILLGRRRRILERYLTRLSPLSPPSLSAERDGIWLCTVDLAVLADVAQPRPYEARLMSSAPETALEVRSRPPGSACVHLPALLPAGASGHEMVIEMSITGASSAPGPIRFHLYESVPGGWLLTGVERL
jgi:hypothetical protein